MIIEALAAYDYEPTFEQRDQIERADDPAQVAAWLPERIESLRAGFAQAVQCDPALVPYADILPAIDLSRALRGYNAASAVETVMAQLGRNRNFALGRKIGKAEADPLTAIYREVLGREPDLEGLEYWRGVYADGLPLSEVIRHIENSDEARG